jgi:hypothetical protein
VSENKEHEDLIADAKEYLSAWHGDYVQRGTGMVKQLLAALESRPPVPVENEHICFSGCRCGGKGVATPVPVTPPPTEDEVYPTVDPLHRATSGDSLHNAWRAGYRLGWDDRGAGREWRKYEGNPYPEDAARLSSTPVETEENWKTLVDRLVSAMRNAEGEAAIASETGYGTFDDGDLYEGILRRNIRQVLSAGPWLPVTEEKKR